MIAIVDYGVGNLFSLQSSLQSIGAASVVTGNATQLGSADKIILPGVGAFGDAMAKLNATSLAETVRCLAGEGKPLLGICLGMQLLFARSFEFGRHEGLALVEGEIRPLTDALRKAGFPYKVPHMGWNPMQLRRAESPLLRYSKPGESVYYVHSYYATGCEASTIVTSEYGISVTGAVQRGNVYGTQFHPEKSGKAGLAMLRAFAEVV